MNNKYRFLAVMVVMIMSPLAYTAPDKAQLAVWANEAIVATYSYNYKSYLQDQKEIAKYFTSDAWINYTKALNETKLPEFVEKNSYTVSAVATQPPQLISTKSNHWQATMPILVVYKNAKDQQQQNLKAVLNFTTADSGQGVRGLSITSLQTTIDAPPCVCNKEK
jgi:hypothetical protein